MKKMVTWLAFLAATSSLVGCDQPTTEPDVLTVYTARKEQLVKPLFDRFTAETGIEVQYITDSAGPLLARIEAEGENTPADVFITVDAGHLWHAAQSGVLAPINSEILSANVPANLRDPNNLWFGLSQRARTMVYNTDAVAPEELSSYEALAGEAWNDRLCLRTSQKVYNQSLVATMIEADGEQVTRDVVSGWVANLAQEPFSNDTKAMQAVAAGACDVTIVNTYYFGRLQLSDPELPLALFWANQGDDERGIHVNISGAGVLKYAPNPELGQQLIEWLSQPEAQYLFAEINQEFPVNGTVDRSAQVSSWGDFKTDQVNLSVAGERQAQAMKLMDEVGYR